MTQPLHDWVLIEPKDAEVESSSGIILATEENKKTETATIIATGTDMQTALKPGDDILFKSYLTDEVSVGKEVLIFIKEGDIIAKV